MTFASASIDNGIDVLVKTLGKEIYVTWQVLEETRLLYAWFQKQDIAGRIDVAVSKGVKGRLDVLAVEEDARLFTAMISGNFPGLPVSMAIMIPPLGDFTMVAHTV